MGRVLLLFLFCLGVASTTYAQEAPTRPRGVVSEKPMVFIATTGDDFNVYLAAAIVKKGVPVTLVEKQEDADFILKASVVEVQKVGSGTKVLNCLFAYCGGNADKGSTSAQLVKDGLIAWSYSVNKGRGEKNKQALAEAIAKHLKNDYFHQK